MSYDHNIYEEYTRLANKSCERQKEIELNREAERQKRKKTEIISVIWITFGIIFGIPILFSGFNLGVYFSVLFFFSFRVPILPILWFTAMFPMALYWNRKINFETLVHRI